MPVHLPRPAPTRRAPLLAGALLALIGAPLGAQQIDTRTANSSTSSFYVEHTVSSTTPPTYVVTSIGQTFRAPGATPVLDAFSFFLNGGGYANSGAFGFQAFLTAFDATTGRSTGEILWQSDARSGSTAPETDVNGDPFFEPFAFTTGGLTLDPTRTYYAFLSSFNQVSGFTGAGAYGNGVQSVFDFGPNGFQGTYADGGAVNWRMTTTGGTLTGQLLAQEAAFFDNTSSADLGFTATFSAPKPPEPPVDMPEPTSLGVLALGLAALGRTMHRRATRWSATR